jgi:hypothetical protein
MNRETDSCHGSLVERIALLRQAARPCPYVPLTSGKTPKLGAWARFQTIIERSNSMTTVPSCWMPRVRTVTMPRFGSDFYSRTDNTSVSA